MADLNHELEAGYYSRIHSIIVRIDQAVAELEEQGYDPADILDGITEYAELSQEYGYLR